MKLNYEGLKDRAAWEKAGIALPKTDWAQMAEKTEKQPVWVHFGAGNIFRGFIAGLQQKLLDEGLQESGIVAAETFDYEIIDRIYEPHDSMTLMVSLLPDGSTRREVIASIAKGVKADSKDVSAWAELKRIFACESLQMVSFTITEKGYALRDVAGQLMPVVLSDMADGPDHARHAMSIVAALLYHRYLQGGAPLAVVSMDNCSHNGEKLRASVVEMARAWCEKGFVTPGFVEWVEDEEKVSFPWSMIDKITPRPSESVLEQLKTLGCEDMDVVVTQRHTWIAPFVNAEVPQYLVVEDRFPNGRPPLEKAGVYMTDRDTVNMTERMKVTTCLNPLHTAMSVFGCLLGYQKISDEMQDADIRALIERIGYTEGLPVVTDPGILSPKAFIDEVVQERLPNPFMPDTPQRICTDTSQKIPVRFGETLKSYAASDTLNPANLVAIPLALAGWLRYLVGVDDEGREMPISPDPMLEQLQAQLQGVTFGQPGSVGTKLQPILENPIIFGLSLKDAGLDQKVTGLFREMLKEKGSVRKVLHETLAGA